MCELNHQIIPEPWKFTYQHLVSFYSYATAITLTNMTFILSGEEEQMNQQISCVSAYHKIHLLLVPNSVGELYGKQCQSDLSVPCKFVFTKKKKPLKKENERMKERIAGKINREELSIYSSIYSSYPFLSLKFLSWLAEQTKNTLQTHKLFHQIFSHVSRWKISSLNTDINQEKKNK